MPEPTAIDVLREYHVLIYTLSPSTGGHADDCPICAALALVEQLVEAAEAWAYERRRIIDGETATDNLGFRDAEASLVTAALVIGGPVQRRDSEGAVGLFGGSEEGA